jgi:hypothetical protein
MRSKKFPTYKTFVIITTDINKQDKLVCSYSESYSKLGFVHTHYLDLVISLSDAISIEMFPSFQIAIAGDCDNM